MKHPKILVVEDEQILAEDLRDILESYDYDVVGIVGSAEKAVKEARKLKPDLIMMDIMLSGKKDGIDAAQEITRENHVPVVFLTAYADETTVQRAIVTQPFGYLLKPFKEHEIHTTIQVALNKHGLDMVARKRERWLSQVLISIGDALIATDEQGKITLMNPAAEAVTGWQLKDAVGKDSEAVLKLIDEKTGKKVEDPIEKAIQAGDVVYTQDALLILKGGRKTRIQDSAAPIFDDEGKISGAVVLFRDGRRKGTN